MTSSSRYLSLRDYLRVLRDHRVLIVVITAVFAVVANRISNQIQPSYSAQASLALGSFGQDLTLGGLSGASSDQLPSQTPAINAETISDPAILGPAVALLHKQGFRHVTVAGLRGSLSARVEAQSSLIILQVSASNPRLAQAAVNAVARSDVGYATFQERRKFTQAADGLKGQLATVQHGSTDQAARALYADQIAKLRSLAKVSQGAQVTQLARLPGSPSYPTPVRDTLLAGLVGLTLAIVAAFMRSALDRRVRGAAQIQRELGVTLLSRVAAGAMGRAATASNGRKGMRAPDLEAFRILHANLDFLAPEGRLVSVAVTSPLSEEGKSTVAVSLAYASYWAGRRTLLIEADLRRPSIAGRLGLKTDPGLNELLSGAATLEQVLQPMPIESSSGNGKVNGNGNHPVSDNADAQPSDGSVTMAAALDVITAGGPPAMPAELLGTSAFEELLERVSGQYDAVILDTAPLLPVADTLKVLPRVDGILVCVRVGRTRGDELRATREALEHLPQRPVGLVVTGVRRGDEEDYGYYRPAKA